MRPVRFAVALFFLAVAVAFSGTRTPAINLYKPANREPNYASKVNTNFDILDARACGYTATTTSQFTVGDVVYLDTTTGQVDLAQADDSTSGKFNGLVSRVISPTSVEVQTCGRFDGLTDDAAAALTPGTIYYLSDTLAGGIDSVQSSLTLAPEIGTALDTDTIVLAPGGGGGGTTVESVSTTAPVGHIAVSDGTALSMVSTSTIELTDFNSDEAGVAASEGQVLSADGASGTAWTFAAGGQNVIPVTAFAPTDAEPTGIGWVAIELGQDSAPSDAIGAVISWDLDVANATTIQLRRDSSDTPYEIAYSDGDDRQIAHPIAWFASGTQQFEASFTMAPGAITVNEITVIGYVVEASVGSRVENVHFLESPDAIGDFVLPSTVGAPGDTVYVGDDGVPSGSAAVLVRVYIDDPSSVAGDWILSLRDPDSSNAGLPEFFCTTEENAAGEAAVCEGWVGLDSGLNFEGWNNSSRTFTNYHAAVVGYALNNADPSKITYVADQDGTLAVNDVVYLDTTSNRVSKSRADVAATSKFDGVVKKVISTSQVQVQTIGEKTGCTDDTGAALVPGTNYFISEAVSGAVTGTQPTGFPVFVGRALNSSTLVMLPDRSLSLGSLNDVDLTSPAPVNNSIIRYNGTKWQVGDREHWYQASSRSSSSGDYAVRAIGNNGSANFSFRVPFDFNTLVSAAILGIPMTTNAAANIDLNTDYAGVGEDAQTHSESDLTSTYNITNNQVVEIPITGVVSSLTAGDVVGVLVTHNAIGGGGIGYLGIRLRYR